MTVELEPVQVVTFDGTTVWAQYWADATAPTKKLARYPAFMEDTKYTARELGLPTGGATYRWMVTTEGTPRLVLVAEPRRTRGRFVEVVQGVHR